MNAMDMYLFMLGFIFFLAAGGLSFNEFLPTAALTVVIFGWMFATKHSL